MSLSHRTVVVFSLLVLASAALATPADDAWNAFLAGDFVRVTQIVQASAGDTTLSTTERSRLYFSLGCSEAMRGKDAAAAGAFQRALTLNPKLKYSEGELPPPAWKIFRPLQESVTRDPAAFQKSSPDTIRVVQPVPFPRDATVRSLAFPGWGHIYVGDKRGYIFSAGEILLLAGLTGSIWKGSEARDDYSRARTAAEASRLYESYNNWHRLSWALGFVSAGAYLAAQWDFFSRPPELTLQPKFGSGIQMSIAITL